MAHSERTCGRRPSCATGRGSPNCRDMRGHPGAGRTDRPHASPPPSRRWWHPRCAVRGYVFWDTSGFNDTVLCSLPDGVNRWAPTLRSWGPFLLPHTSGPLPGSARGISSRNDTFATAIDGSARSSTWSIPSTRGCRLSSTSRGTGTVTRRLLQRSPSARLIAVDVDPVLLAIATASFDGDDRMRIVRADLRDPAWRDAVAEEQVDAAVTSTALHWLPEGAVRRLYHDLARLIRPGGVFAHAEVMPLADAPNLGAGLARVKRHRRPGNPSDGSSDWDAWWRTSPKTLRFVPQPKSGKRCSRRTIRPKSSHHPPSGTLRPCATPASSKPASSGVRAPAPSSQPSDRGGRRSAAGRIRLRHALPALEGGLAVDVAPRVLGHRPAGSTASRSPNRSRARSAVWFAPRRC